MQKIKNYVKESLEHNRIRRWNKKDIYVHITEITYPEYKKEQAEYIALLKRGLNCWNKILNNKMRFIITNNASDADISVRFIRVSTQYWGMCCYDSVVNSEFKKLTIKLGVTNEFCNSKLNSNDKYVIILHEFGHAIGLGHCDESCKNIMTPGYYPTKNWISINDYITANIIYDLPKGAYYSDIENEISKLESKYLTQKTTQNPTPKEQPEDSNILENLEEIGNLKLWKMNIESSIKLPDNFKNKIRDISIQNNEQKKSGD